MLEAFTEAEAQRNADHNRQQVTFLQEQLNRSLETLREWTHERPLLVAHQQALSAKVKKLQGALRKVLMSNRQRVMEAKEEAEEEVFQKLSKWRESLVRTTVEATKGRCGSLCHSRGKHHSCSSGELARRHAAAEIAILELTEALSKANLRLACSLNSSINKLSDRKEEVIRKKTEEGPAKPTTDSGIPLGSATIGTQGTYSCILLSYTPKPLGGHTQLLQETVEAISSSAATFKENPPEIPSRP